MNRNNHTPHSDADTLRKVDRLVNEGQASGDPVLDNLRVHIPRADAIRAQALEDELAAMWEAGTQDDLIASPDTAKPYMNRVTQPSRAGRLPYMATLAAMIALVAAAVLLNRPSQPGTASQITVTAPPTLVPSPTRPIVTTAPGADPLQATAASPDEQATQIQAEILTATQISQPDQPPNPPAENCYIVQADDTIESIAQENGITAEQILQANVEIARSVETDDGIFYTIWLSPASCLRLSPPNPVPGGLVSIIAPYSLLVPRDSSQPARLEVGDTISLYVGLAMFTTWDESNPPATTALELLASDVQVMAILEYADEYVISVPQAIHPVITWLWKNGEAQPLVYAVE